MVAQEEKARKEKKKKKKAREGRGAAEEWYCLDGSLLNVL